MRKTGAAPCNTQGANPPSATDPTEAPTPRTPLKVVGALILLGALWGSSFPLVKIAAPALGPVGVTHARLAIGTVVLILLTLTDGKTWRVIRRRFGAFMVLAILNVAGPLTLVAIAIVGLNASMAAILNATTPLFTVVVASTWLGQRITWRHVVSVTMGVVGVVVLLGGAPIDIGRRGLLFAAASLAAAVLYAFGGVYARRAFPDEKPLAVALGQLLAATLLMVPASLVAFAVSPPAAPVTNESILAVLVVGVGATAGGYILYFWIIRTAGPLAASTVTFIVPLAGASLGVLWLNEPATTGLAVGLLSILVGVGLPARQAERPASERDAATRRKG